MDAYGVWCFGGGVLEGMAWVSCGSEGLDLVGVCNALV